MSPCSVKRLARAVVLSGVLAVGAGSSGNNGGPTVAGNRVDGPTMGAPEGEPACYASSACVAAINEASDMFWTDLWAAATSAAPNALSTAASVCWWGGRVHGRRAAGHFGAALTRPIVK